MPSLEQRLPKASTSSVFVPVLPCVPKFGLLLFCSEKQRGFSKHSLALTPLMPCLPFWPALDLNCPWEPPSNPHSHSRHSLQLRYCTLLPPWRHWPAEMASAPTLGEVYCRLYRGPCEEDKGGGKRGVCPLIPTEKSGPSSSLVCEPQSGWRWAHVAELLKREVCAVVAQWCLPWELGEEQGAGPALAALASESEPSLYKGGNLASQREGSPEGTLPSSGRHRR